MSYSSSDPPSAASSELKLYQTFIFSIPIFFTFLLLLLFYLFYLRRRRVDWSSLRMRASSDLNNGAEANRRFSESGLKKEFREMLPIIVFKESFSVKDTQCSVCLGEYEADEKLQQLPACGHTFHMVCIDHWLSTHTTCPLCRLSLVPTTRSESEPQDHQPDTQTSDESSESGNENGRSLHQTGDSDHCTIDVHCEKAGDEEGSSVVVLDVEETQESLRSEHAHN